MAKVLVFYDNEDIRGWLVDVDISEAPGHIKNGYWWLTERFAAGTVKALNIEVPDEEMFKMEYYGVVNGEVARII